MSDFFPCGIRYDANVALRLGERMPPVRDVEGKTTSLERNPPIKIVRRHRENKVGEFPYILPPKDDVQCLLKDGVAAAGDSVEVFAILVFALLRRPKLVGVHNEQRTVLIRMRGDRKIEPGNCIVRPIEEPGFHAVMLLKEVEFGLTFVTAANSG